MAYDSSLILPQLDRRAFLKGAATLAASAMSMPLLPAGGAFAGPRIIPAGKRLTRFAHITDLHFTNRKQNRYPTSHYHIRQAVQDLNSQDLDFVLFTGDMFHFPEDMALEMETLTDALKGLKKPYYCAIGNHDAEGDGVIARKKFFNANIGDQGLVMGENYYTFSPIDGLRFVVLDSTDVDGDAYHAWTGHLGEVQMKWLEATLTKHREETIFIAIHHPPITPYPFMDKLKFEQTPRDHLAEMLNRFPNVQLMFAGHYHFGGRNRFGKAELLLGPSLVEHPHPYRIVEVQKLQAGAGGKGAGTHGSAASAAGVVSYEWKSLHLHGDEDVACAHGTPGMRSYGLMRLSYEHNGFMPLELPG